MTVGVPSPLQLNDTSPSSVTDTGEPEAVNAGCAIYVTMIIISQSGHYLVIISLNYNA